MASSLTPFREPVLVFLHSPTALRVEYNLDLCRLQLWWSPGAGISADAEDRNFSSRDVHLDVFESIRLPGCSLDAFLKCEYDPWKLVLHFKRQILTLSVFSEHPMLMIQAEAPQPVDVVTRLEDTAVEANDRCLRVQHRERGRLFTFRLRGPEGFAMRHSPKPSPGNKVYSRGVLPAGQNLLLEVGEGNRIVPSDPSDPTDQTDAWLAPIESAGRLVEPAEPLLEQTRRLNQRGLAAMVDHSGAVRASIKAIYYLIWIRDAVFAAAGCVSGGWPHRLDRLCALLLENPCAVDEPDLPKGRMFAQLINKSGGRLEEDGAFYVLWALFLHWTHSGDCHFVAGESLTLLREAMDWVDRRCFDAERGLYGGHFADETAAWGSRDQYWDHVTGIPVDGSDHIRVDGKPVVRSYDIYLNTLMHSAWTMLARIADDSDARDRADALWERLRIYYTDLKDGLPAYGDLILRDGGEERVYAFGPVTSVYLWALTLPNFLPLDGKDITLQTLLERVAAEPGMHWMNGLCSAISACDPWVSGEETQLSLLLRISEDSMKPGPWHPMAGAMPEKFEAPQGSLHHDIRPQAFAMGAWLGALASLGTRHLPHGLALRPTQAYRGIENHEAFGKQFDLDFTPDPQTVLRVNGHACPHSLQVPENALRPGRNTLALGGRPEERPLLLRSDVKLLSVEALDDHVAYLLEVFGTAELLIEGNANGAACMGDDGVKIEFTLSKTATRNFLRFRHRGGVTVKLKKEIPPVTRRPGKTGVE